MGFDKLAGEYYDAKRHRTTADLRLASDAALERIVVGFKPIPGSSVLEVGAGRPSAPSLNLDTGLLVATDASAGMLVHARGHVALQADALQLPFTHSSFDVVVAALAAPYNQSGFFFEAARVLRVGGHLLMTTPAHEWALNSRPDGQGGVSNRAIYTTEDGAETAVPSITRSIEEQHSLLWGSGFATRAVVTIDARDLASENASDKPSTPADALRGVATGFLAQLVAIAEPADQNGTSALYT